MESNDHCLGKSLVLQSNLPNSQHIVRFNSTSKATFSELVFNSLTLLGLSDGSNQIYVNPKYANYLQVTSQRKSQTILLARQYHSSAKIEKIILNNQEITTLKLVINMIIKNQSMIAFNGYCNENSKLGKYRIIMN